MISPRIRLKVSTYVWWAGQLGADVGFNTNDRAQPVGFAKENMTSTVSTSGTTIEPTGKELVILVCNDWRTPTDQRATQW